MKIELVKFGEILTSRQDGKEALLAAGHRLENLNEKEIIEIDFRWCGCTYSCMGG